ncbi:MAG: hypothetical protein R3176_03915 [Woeseiaceae bacterium]|nr:hypothetical protein [Woeseiaceae bacterium]
MRKTWTLILLFATTAASAHIPLTSAIVGDAFDEIAAAEAAVAAAESEQEKAAAVYALGVAAGKLTDLLNQEIALHGTEQQELIDAAVAHAGERGITITWSDAHERYFYAGDAFRRHVALAGDSLEAANSRFHLIETGFYLGDPGDRAGLTQRIDMEREYLARFPTLGNAGRVAMFLAVDYRDLWRLCVAAGDADCASGTAARLRAHLEWTIEQFSNERTSGLARSFLERFDAERAALAPPSG